MKYRYPYDIVLHRIKTWHTEENLTRNVILLVIFTDLIEKWMVVDPRGMEHPVYFMQGDNECPFRSYLRNQRENIKVAKLRY